jgi:Protein of unknown function (DUF551).
MNAIDKFYELAEAIGLNINYLMGYSVADKFVESFTQHIKSSLWIRPQDQMPEQGKPVLITDVEGLQVVAWYVADRKMWYSENHSWFTSEVNYWMPIPEIV